MHMRVSVPGKMNLHVAQPLLEQGFYQSLGLRPKPLFKVRVNLSHSARHDLAYYKARHSIF